jgi:7-carboxy-7-deazaguanine synthase
LARKYGVSGAGDGVTPSLFNRENRAKNAGGPPGRPEDIGSEEFWNGKGMKLARMSGTGREPEIFLSVQGEGPSAGTPCVFARGSLCNLYCRWCDTDYTWNWLGTTFEHERDSEPGYAKYRREDEILEMSVEAVVASVMAFDCRRMVITGGEPLVQQAGWLEVIDALRAADAAWFFEVETNGTITPRPELMEGRVNQFNVSPKLTNSNVPEELRLRDDVLRLYAQWDNAFFKFVLNDVGDFDEVRVMAERYGLVRDRIYLMPQGSTVEALNERQGWVEALCRAEGFRFSDRLHIRRFGNRRGV